MLLISQHVTLYNMLANSSQLNKVSAFHSNFSGLNFFLVVMATTYM